MQLYFLALNRVIKLNMHAGIINSMGITNLKKLIAEAASIVSLNTYASKMFAVDISIWLHKFLYYGEGDQVITCLAAQIEQFCNANITPVYVFDGECNDDVKRASIKRRETKTRDRETLTSLKESIVPVMLGETGVGQVVDEKTLTRIESLEKRTRCLSAEILQQCKDLLDQHNTPHMQAVYEADTLIAELCARGLVHGVFSEDVDMLTYGCERLVTKFQPNSNIVTEYLLSNVLNELGMTYEQFVDFCILCGCDYSTKIYGIAIMNARKLIKQHQTIEQVLVYVTSTDKLAKRHTYDVDFMTQVALARNMFTLRSPDGLPMCLCKEPLLVSCDNIADEI